MFCLHSSQTCIYGNYVALMFLSAALPDVRNSLNTSGFKTIYNANYSMRIPPKNGFMRTQSSLPFLVLFKGNFYALPLKELLKDNCSVMLLRGWISYHRIRFYPWSDCLIIQVTSLGRFKGPSLSSVKSDLEHVFEEMCCWSTSLCGQNEPASDRHA